MKKLLALILTLTTTLCMVFAFSSCGDSKKTQTEFKPTGTVNGTLKLGFDAEYPPFGYLDSESNQYKGFDIDIAKLACEKIGYTLVLIPIDWDYKDAELTAGNIDCIWSGMTMNCLDDDGVNRNDKYTFSPAYSDNSIVVLVKGNAITSLDDLASKILSVQAGSSAETAVKENEELVATLKDGKYITCKDYTAAFTELDSGAIDALAIDIGTGRALVGNKTGFNTIATIANEQYGIAFKKGNTELMNKVWGAIEALDKADIQKIAAEYELQDQVIIGK